MYIALVKLFQNMIIWWCPVLVYTFSPYLAVAVFLMTSAVAIALYRDAKH